MKSKNSHDRADVSNVSVKQVRTFGKWSAGREQKKKMLPSRQASEQFSSVLISLSRAERQAGKGKGRTRGKDRAKQAIIGGGSNDTVTEPRRRGQMSGHKVGKEGREMVNGQAEKNRYFTQCHLVVVVVP